MRLDRLLPFGTLSCIGHLGLSCSRSRLRDRLLLRLALTDRLPVSVHRLNATSERVGTQRPAEEQDVRLGSVRLVVNPTARLLHAQRAPLVLVEMKKRIAWQSRITDI